MIGGPSRTGVMTMLAALVLAVIPGPTDDPAADGRRVPLPGGAVLLLPDAPSGPGPIDLVVHLHGSAEAVERALDASGWRAAAVVVNEPGLSSAYAGPFSDPGHLARLLDEAKAALGRAMPGVDPEGGRLIVGAFSAGFGGVRELLGQPGSYDRIDALVLADALYCGYDERGDPGAPRPDPEKMAGFRRFAAEAAAGRKAMLVSHCFLVPDGYAGTHETAEDLVGHVGGAFEAAGADLGDGWRLVRRFRRGGLLVVGFDGTRGEDHLRHLRRLGELWRMLPAAASP